MNEKSGFTLIELMIVVAIIAIIAAIAIPNLLRSRMSANEASAVGAIRTISTGQVGYQTSVFTDYDGNGDGDYAALPQLANPDGAGVTPPYIDTVLGTGSKHGYNFQVTITPGSAVSNAAYICTAFPHSLGRTGYRQYVVDDTGVIRFTADGTLPNLTSPPLN
jgi:type IV pilus assembly protein PilA